MVSQLVCDFVFDHSDEVFDYMVQGDDILMRGWGRLDSSKIVRVASAFGMYVNEAKSTTGPAAVSVDI